jgi:hypothetical protein
LVLYRCTREICCQQGMMSQHNEFDSHMHGPCDVS